jgi:hypothetical protein
MGIDWNNRGYGDEHDDWWEDAKHATWFESLSGEERHKLMFAEWPTLPACSQCGAKAGEPCPRPIGYPCLRGKASGEN